jgi:periplasmic copper chaperone A
MKRFIATAASVVLSALLVGSAHARDVTKGPIKIEQPWTRATPGGAKVAGGFMKITNTGTTPDRLVSATADISGVVELHEMKMVEGIMKMRALGNGIELKPGQTVDLKPGGYHVMFIDLKAPIVKEKPIKARLTFEKAGEIEVEFKVEPIGAKSPAGGGGGGHHKH